MEESSATNNPQALYRHRLNVAETLWMNIHQINRFLGQFSQHFIFFITHEWPKLDCHITLGRKGWQGTNTLAIGSLVSYEENEVLCKQSLFLHVFQKHVDLFLPLHIQSCGSPILTVKWAGKSLLCLWWVVFK
jgi:hypothetical protein